MVHKFNNFGLVLGMTLKFYSRVAKELKLKVTKLWELILTFTVEKMVGGMASAVQTKKGKKKKKKKKKKKNAKRGEVEHFSLIRRKLRVFFVIS